MAMILKKLTPNDVQDILGRAMLDSAFRAQLLTDPGQTIMIMGYEQSADSLAFFKALDSDTFKDAATDVENRLGGRPVIGVLWF